MKWIVIVLLVFALPLTGAGQSLGSQPMQGAGGRDTIITLTPAELNAMLGMPHLFVYDCNEEEIYSAAHIPEARLTVYDQISTEILPKDTGETVVFYCYSPECSAAPMAAKAALDLGYAHVCLMPLGITGWQEAGLPTKP
jgi:rhodanese-related sulfurtransferase